MLMFLWGANALACWAVGVLFLRYWRHTRDRLFVFFAAAFWVLCLSWTILALADPPDEARHFIYVIRVIAFLLLIFGIVDKNKRGSVGS
jgi:uncharacterized membrane protein